jgi:hypothetical protein
LITALKARAADVLHGIPTNATHGETLQALEDSFGDQHFPAAFRNQPNRSTQKAEESLQDFATAVEQVAHRAYPSKPKNRVKKDAGKKFSDRVQDDGKNFAADRRGD